MFGGPYLRDDWEFTPKTWCVFITHVELLLRNFQEKSVSVTWENVGALVEFIWNDPEGYFIN